MWSAKTSHNFCKCDMKTVLTSPSLMILYRSCTSLVSVNIRPSRMFWSKAGRWRIKCERRFDSLSLFHLHFQEESRPRHVHISLSSPSEMTPAFSGLLKSKKNYVPSNSFLFIPLSGINFPAMPFRVSGCCCIKRSAGKNSMLMIIRQKSFSETKWSLKHQEHS